ncbi:MAG: endopeptidase La [Candidatus Poribacteria bacterium]|nr:endopeptidase La [Candidatus Poribacteria bacterium]
MESDSVETRQDDQSTTLPVIALPGKVIFPRVRQPLIAARTMGVLATKHAIESNQSVMLLNQKEKEAENAGPEDLHRVGTVANIIESYDPNDETIRIAIEAETRAIVLHCFEKDGFLQAEVKKIYEESDQSKQALSLMKKALATFEKYGKANKQMSPDAAIVAQKEKEPGLLADTMIDFTNIDSEKRQSVLDEINPIKRLQLVIDYLSQELDLVALKEKINTQVRESVQKTHREFYLQEQMKVIQNELGRGDDVAEIDELREQIKTAGMTEEGEEKALKEVDRLQQMPPMSAESGVIRTYIDWLLAVPWQDRTENKVGIDEAEQILDDDHYGLEKPKERILEYLAVLKLVEKLKGPILCLVGPPGVGKTSLGKSVARATGRNFVRMSLGGVRDEAEIRGHRRTYIGALPGRIIQGLRDAKSKNPLFLLDEIDKMSSDFRGDPASALLEVLDPEQNDTFRDHYLDVQYDLSEVMFITTANTRVTIPPALQDRMEIIELPGYTEFEKHKIANLFLISKQLKEHGLADESIEISDDAISEIIQRYTREAGVRNLEREITSICRKVAKQIVKDKATDGEGNGEEKRIHVSAENLSDYLGPPKFTRTKAEEQDEVGVATGMVWTQVGGDIVAVEATTMAGEGKLSMTGQLQEIMRESVQTAVAYIRSRAELFSIPPNFFEKHDVHIHVPEGAVPKDGPSAGVTLATAIVSVLTGQRVRKDIAMTGEITLRGHVLPIGGLKEKVLAAYRNGIKTIIIPEDNDKDIPEIPDEIRDNICFHKVGDITEVLALALKDDRTSEGDLTDDEVAEALEDLALRTPDAIGQVPTGEPNR